MRMILTSLVLFSLTGCAGLSKPVTPVFVPPASCLEHAADIPEPKPDLIEYVQDLIVLYSDGAVLREQCRAALVGAQDATEY